MDASSSDSKFWHGSSIAYRLFSNAYNDRIPVIDPLQIPQPLALILLDVHLQ